MRELPSVAMFQRAMIAASIRDPKAQAIIRGPLIDYGVIVLSLTPLEAHFFLLDRGDE